MLLLGGSLAAGWGLQRGAHQNPLPGKRDFGWGSGLILKLLGPCPLAVAAVLSGKVQADRWVAPHLAVRTLFDCCRWTCQVTQPVQRTPLWPASWLPAVEKSWGSSRLRFKGFGRFMMSVFSSCLVRMLCSWMSPLVQVMFLLLGLSGPGLLRLHLLMLISLVVDPFLVWGLVLGRVSASCRGRQAWWSQGSESTW